MLVAIAGSQGAGKSSVLAELAKQGYQTITRKTSRSILTDWNVTLDQINSDSDLTKKFQEEIIIRKFNDEYEAVNSPNIVFTERTYGDLFTYSLFSIGKYNEFNEWTDNYFEQCMRYQQSYHAVYYITAGHFVPVADGVRAANRHYSKLVDLAMLDVTQQMTLSKKLNVVTTANLAERVALISSQCQSDVNPYGYSLGLKVHSKG